MSTRAVHQCVGHYGSAACPEVLRRPGAARWRWYRGTSLPPDAASCGSLSRQEWSDPEFAISLPTSRSCGSLIRRTTSAGSQRLHAGCRPRAGCDSKTSPAHQRPIRPHQPARRNGRSHMPPAGGVWNAALARGYAPPGRRAHGVEGGRRRDRTELEQLHAPSTCGTLGLERGAFQFCARQRAKDRV
jgi:hypothetical protein